MRKIFVILLFLLSSQVWAQEMRNIYDEAPAKISKRLSFQREKWFYEQRIFPTGKFPMNAYENAFIEEVTKPSETVESNKKLIQQLTKRIDELNQKNGEIISQIEKSKVQLNEQKLVYMFNIGIIEQATNDQIEAITNI